MSSVEGLRSHHLRTGRKTASSIGERNRRGQPWLEGMEKCNEIFWKTIGLDFVKQVVGMSSGLKQIRNWRVEGLATSVAEKEATHGVRAGYVGALATP
jgi:hypothetical protein